MSALPSTKCGDATAMRPPDAARPPCICARVIHQVEEPSILVEKGEQVQRGRPAPGSISAMPAPHIVDGHADIGDLLGSESAAEQRVPVGLELCAGVDRGLGECVHG